MRDLDRRARDRALASGALAFVAKPIQSRDVLDGLLDHLHDFLARPARRLLVVEPDPARRDAAARRPGRPTDVQVTAAADGPAAAAGAGASAASTAWSLGPATGRTSPTALAAADGEPAAVVSPAAGRSSTATATPAPTDDGRWRRLADACTVRRAHSPGRLLDLATFFLHRAARQAARGAAAAAARPATSPTSSWPARRC